MAAIRKFFGKYSRELFSTKIRTMQIMAKIYVSLIFHPVKRDEIVSLNIFGDRALIDLNIREIPMEEFVMSKASIINNTFATNQQNFEH